MSRYRRSYAADATLCDRVFELIGTAFPELPAQRRRAERLHWRWEDVSTPFVHVEEGRVISHGGLLEMNAWLLGEERTLGGIHAVCTREQRRRQGLSRRVMHEVLDYCHGLYDTLILTTDQPRLYEPFGFRVVREQRFIARAPAPGGGPGLRALDLDSMRDLALLDAMLERRAPVSDVVGVVREKGVFKFNQADEVLYRSESLNLIAALEREGRRLVVRDVVAPVMCPLRALLDELAEPVDEVVICFSPDRLESEAHRAPLAQDDGILMARGPFEPEGRPFMLPPTARH